MMYKDVKSFQKQNSHYYRNGRYVSLMFDIQFPLPYAIWTTVVSRLTLASKPLVPIYITR